jgi:hypothetical protein
MAIFLDSIEELDGHSRLDRKYEFLNLVIDVRNIQTLNMSGD